MKGPTGKTFGGIYSNPLFIHSAASLVGCVVHVQVKNGSVYEGVFRTFSQKVDVVLEMAHKVELKKTSNNINAVLNTLVHPDEIMDKLIFKIEDVVMLSALNIDPEFATHDHFTDASISKFNGQVLEKELEPWDGGSLPGESVPELGTDEANGWDPNDMFRTNEVKYGVKTCFDSTLQGYTIPLNRQDTEEYKQQEAKATKIAQEIESGFHYKNRLALENGDEEERYSAVLRTDNNSNRFITHRGRKPPGVRPARPSPSPSSNYQGNRISHPHSQSYHKTASLATVNSHGGGKANSYTSPTSCVPTPLQRPTTSPNSNPHQSTPPSSHQLIVHQPSVIYQQSHVSGNAQSANQPHSGSPHNSEEQKINGDILNSQLKRDVDVPTTNLKEKKTSNDVSTRLEQPHKSIEQHKDPEKKTLRQKGYENKTDDLKRFHEKFKLPESKDIKESKEEFQKSEVPLPQRSGSDVSLNSKQIYAEKTKEDENDTESADMISPDTAKNFTLNPNAKEFIFNPNAKSFTPRAVPLPNTVVPPPVQPPPRLHTQSPVMAVPQPHMISGVPQPIFANVASHYVVSAPGSIPMGPPYTPVTSMSQAPRYGKAMPITLQRHDMSQSIHVQAATGQPILAPPSLSAPQFALQYNPNSGILHPQGPPQPQLTYTQKTPTNSWIQYENTMYSVMGPRVFAPQPMRMVSSSASYGENHHVPTHLYMTHPGTPSIQHGVPPGGGGQHSAPSTPQSQTPNHHPAPSPVHQPPPSTPHGQQQTPTGHNNNQQTPQVVYHSHMPNQHPLHGNPASSNQNHPYPGSYSATPQPIMLLQQSAVPGPHALHPATFSATLQNHHLHGQNHGSHAGTPTHVMPHPSVAMMPGTAAAMVHNQTQMSSGNYVPHSQA